MATIQIRDVPDDSYAVIRRRAEEEGRSLQSFMRSLLIEYAARPTPAEVFGRLDTFFETDAGPGLTREQIVEARDADRR